MSRLPNGVLVATDEATENSPIVRVGLVLPGAR